MEINWQINTFNELSPNEIHDIFQLRNDVFVIEQNCVYQDIDGKDIVSIHIFGYHKREIIAYLRIVPSGVSYPEISIGRVCVNKNYRKLNLGIDLMNKSIEYITLNMGEDEKIRISAQTYLLNFYKKFGFESTGKEYLEDDIPHTEMVKI